MSVGQGGTPHSSLMATSLHCQTLTPGCLCLHCRPGHIPAQPLWHTHTSGAFAGHTPVFVCTPLTRPSLTPQNRKTMTPHSNRRTQSMRGSRPSRGLQVQIGWQSEAGAQRQTYKQRTLSFLDAQAVPRQGNEPSATSPTWPLLPVRNRLPANDTNGTPMGHARPWDDDEESVFEGLSAPCPV